jgi:hypothetical protein
VATFDADSNQTSIYVDGVKSSTDGFVNNSNLFGGDIFIGSAGGTAPYFSGYIDDLRFYRIALSDDNIESLYNSAVYQRYFYVENVSRDGQGNIVLSGGIPDPSTQKITASIEWLGGRNATFSTYLTRISDKIFEQAEWTNLVSSDVVSMSSTSSYSAKNNINLGSQLTLASTTQSGDITSVIYETQVAGGAKINNLVWQGSKNNGQVNIEISYSNNIGSGWLTTSLYNVAPDMSEPINIGDYHYLRYKILMPAITSGISPQVDLISINWSR